MSNIFRDSESLGKSNGEKWSNIWTFLFGSGLKSPRKKKVFFCWLCLGLPSYGVGATIRIGREMLCLPYAGFFRYDDLIPKKLRVFSAENRASDLWMPETPLQNCSRPINPRVSLKVLNPDFTGVIRKCDFTLYHYRALHQCTAPVCDLIWIERGVSLVQWTCLCSSKWAASRWQDMTLPSRVDMRNFPPARCQFF